VPFLRRDTLLTLAAHAPAQAPLLARGLLEDFARGGHPPGGSTTAAAFASRLTPTGAPIEVAFVWPEGDVRLSIDPCPPGTPEQRLRTCADAVEAALAPEQRAVLQRIAGWQAGAPCRYGAWLGLRVRGGAVRRKLYLEVPADAEWREWEASVVGRPAVLPNRGVRATMVGLDPERGGVEVYYRTGPLYAAELDTLLRRQGLPARGSEVVRDIEALTQRTVRFELPTHDSGFSQAFDAGGRPLAFTWYSIADALLGPDARARERLLSVGRARGWAQGLYAALSEGTCHTLVGAVLGADGSSRVTATLAPAPEEAP
jgi:hypothetical protein